MKSITQKQVVFFFFFLLFTFALTARAENIVEPPKTIPNLLKEAAINLEHKTLAPEYVLNVDGELAPLKEYLYYFVDTNADLRVESVANPSIVSDFTTSYDIKAQGTTWVRLLIAPFDLIGDAVPLLDLGANIQGEKNVWLKPKYLDAVQRKENAQGFFAVEELRQGGEIYIAIQGLPSIWFDPRFVPSDSSEDKAKLFKEILMIVLAVLTAIALLTALLSRKSWRIALSIFGFCLLAINYFGLPVTPKGHILPTDIATLFAVALALFSLQFTLKAKLKTSEKAKVVDLFFLLAGIIGFFLPFLVLAPSFAYCVRYIELWQIYTLIYFLLIFPLLFSGVYASLICLSANFVLFVSVVFALAILFNIDALSYFDAYNLDLISLLPLLGQVLAFILLVFSKDEIYSAVKRNKKTKKKNAFVLGNERNEDKAKSEIEEINISQNFTDNTEKVIRNEIPDLSFNTEAEENLSQDSNVEKSKEVAPEIVQEKEVEYRINHENLRIETELSHEEKVEEKFNELQLTEKIDSNFRPSLEKIMRELCFLENQIKDNSSADDLMEKVDNISLYAKNISDKLKELPLILRDKSLKKAKQKINQAFDIEELIKEIFARLREAEYSNLVALSWIKAPHVGKYFVGDREYFGELLFELLSDSMRATEKGSVYLRVQRDKCSNNPGRLSFIVGDSGAGMPPYRRSASLLTKVWELSSDYYGDFYTEHTAKGLEYSFTLSFIALEDDGITEKLITGYNAEKKTRFDKVLILSHNPKQKYMLAFRLSNIECHVLEAMNIEDAYKQFVAVQPSLLIVDTTVSKASLETLINEVRLYEKENTLKKSVLLGLYDNEDDKSMLEFAGCQASLSINEGREAFRSYVVELLKAYHEADVVEAKKIEEISNAIKEESQNNKDTMKFIPIDNSMKKSKEGKKFKFMASGFKAFKNKEENVKEDFVNFNIESKEHINSKNNAEKDDVLIKDELVLDPTMVSYETYPEEKRENKEENSTKNTY